MTGIDSLFLGGELVSLLACCRFVSAIIGPACCRFASLDFIGGLSDFASDVGLSSAFCGGGFNLVDGAGDFFFAGFPNLCSTGRWNGARGLAGWLGFLGLKP